MKKSALILFFFISIFSILSASALEIKSSQSTFSQGETIIFTLQGDIVTSLTKKDVGFYEGHVQKPFNYDMTRIDDKYYVYAITPYKSGDYLLKINKIYFKENNEFHTEDLQFNFSVSNKTADFYVSPGFIISTKDFSILLNNNLNNIIEVSYNFGSNLSQSINIPMQQTKSLLINTKDFSSTIVTSLDLKSSGISYSIPVYLIKNNYGIDENSTNIIDNNQNIKKPNLIFLIQKLNETLRKGDSYNYSIPLVNTGDAPSGEVNLSVSNELKDIVKIYTNKINIPIASEINVVFTITPKKIGNFSGLLIVSSKNSSTELPISLIVGEKITAVSSIKGEKSCGELGGKICSFESGQICNIPNKVSLDSSFCCVGECINGAPEPNGNSSKIIAGTVILVLFLILGFLFFKYKKSRIKDEDILETKVKKFNDEYETHGNLSKF